MVMRIKELRQEKGITQQELADEMGVIQSTISQWEKEIVLPNIREAPRLAAILDCSIDDLFIPLSQTKSADAMQH